MGSLERAPAAGCGFDPAQWQEAPLCSDECSAPNMAAAASCDDTAREVRGSIDLLAQCQEPPAWTQHSWLTFQPELSPATLAACHAIGDDLARSFIRERRAQALRSPPLSALQRWEEETQAVFTYRSITPWDGLPLNTHRHPLISSLAGRALSERVKQLPDSRLPQTLAGLYTRFWQENDPRRTSREATGDTVTGWVLDFAESLDTVQNERVQTAYNDIALSDRERLLLLPIEPPSRSQALREATVEPNEGQAIRACNDTATFNACQDVGRQLAGFVQEGAPPAFMSDRLAQVGDAQIELVLAIALAELIQASPQYVIDPPSIIDIDALETTTRQRIVTHFEGDQRERATTVLQNLWTRWLMRTQIPSPAHSPN